MSAERAGRRRQEIPACAGMTGGAGMTARMWKWIHSPVGDTVVGVVISMGITVMGIGLSWLIWGVMG